MSYWLESGELRKVDAGLVQMLADPAHYRRSGMQVVNYDEPEPEPSPRSRWARIRSFFRKARS